MELGMDRDLEWIGIWNGSGPGMDRDLERIDGEMG